jgi:GNAT superfamily N-acetyltransferase
MNAAISPAMISDAAALLALRTAVAEGMTRDFGAGDWSQPPTRPDVLRQLRASQVLVARRGAELVGTVRLAQALPWAIDASAFTPVTKALYVLGLAVAPPWRNRGIGRELMDAAKDLARCSGAQALWLDAYERRAGAGEFYLKCGFRQVGGTKYREEPLIYFEWLV